MSHFATVETQIRDIGALRGVCTELGLILANDAVARGYGVNTVKGDLVIRLKGPYDIALNRQQDGSYGLTTGWWGGHVEAEVGKGYRRPVAGERGKRVAARGARGELGRGHGSPWCDLTRGRYSGPESRLC